MAVIHPFKAWKPDSKTVAEVSCPPYDVISTAEAREAAEQNPASFFHVIRPEVDLPEGTPYNDEKAYIKGAKNLQDFFREGILTQDDEPALYIYRLTWQGEAQTGIFGCVSVHDYNNDVILKHELTRPAKEDDRTRHITEQQAHAEPVMLTCKDTTGIGDFADEFTANNTPLFDLNSDDGIRHQLWKVAATKPLVDAFAQLSHLYIADGHHRCKAASRAAAQESERRPSTTGEEEFNFFPAVIFPMSEMRILAYNRVIYSLPDGFFDDFADEYALTPTNEPVPDKKGSAGVYYNGNWHKMKLPTVQTNVPSSVEKLDAYRLQHLVLEPALGIKNPREDDNIGFVGGIRGTDELERMVDAGEAQLAISMYPTAIEELVSVSDEGLLMPPKSTWFEPKLRSGLLVHTF